MSRVRCAADTASTTPAVGKGHRSKPRALLTLDERGLLRIIQTPPHTHLLVLYAIPKTYFIGRGCGLWIFIPHYRP